jgi:5'(3')-deoxyribonucleotidase
MEGSQMVIKRFTEKYEVFVTSVARDHPELSRGHCRALVSNPELSWPMNRLAISTPD